MFNPTAEVTEVVHAFSACWNRHDVKAFARLFASDAEFVNVVGLWWHGREEIEKAHEFTHATLFQNSTLTISDVSVRLPVDNVAIARTRWVLKGHVSPDGESLPARHGILVSVLLHSPAGWSIIDSQNTDVIEGQLSRPQ